MAVAPTVFVGGDCNGQLVAPGAPSPLICGTTSYTRGADGNYYAPGATTADLAAAQGTVPHVDAKQVGRAWHRMTHVLSVEAPHAIRRSRAARARLRRLSR